MTFLYGIRLFAVSALLSLSMIPSWAFAETVLQVTQISYDAYNRPVCTAVRMNPAAFGALPTSACTLGAQGSMGPDRITMNVYDAAGQLLQVQRAVGMPLQENYATYTYTPDGKQASVTDANGNKAAYTYDGFDRLVQWNFPDKVTPGAVDASDYEAYTYDPDGNRLSLRKRDGTSISYTYDALNRVTSKVVPASATGAAGYTVNSSYDLLGRQLAVTFAGTGRGITNTYDALGRLTSSSSNMDGTARTMSSTYDAVGNRTLLTGNIASYSAAFTYDNLNRMSAYLGQTIAYDNAGRLSAINSGASSAAYAYDAIDRLTSLAHTLAGTSSNETLAFAYNPASQITSRASSNSSYAYTGVASVNRNYSTNGLNQYLVAGTASFTYDANGNLTADGSNSFVYDDENRLVSVTGAHTATLAYDPLGRLWQISAPSGTTDFIYDGDHDVVETDGSGNAQRAFTWGPGADQPLVWWEGGSRYLHADNQGSIIAAADSSGNMLAINTYDEYGTPGSANQGRFQYTGQAWLSEIGMYYYKARIYSPTLGRFLQTDPVGYKDQINLYEYAKDDPFDLEDPSGEETGQVGYDSIESMKEAFGALPKSEQRERARMGLIMGGIVYGGAACVAGGCEAAAFNAAGRGIQWLGSALGLGQRFVGPSIEAAEAALPKGVTRQIFARVGVWRTEGGVAAAAARSRTVSAESIQSLKDAGVSRDAVQLWQKFYQGASETIRSDGTKFINQTAKYRSEVLNNVLKGW